MSERPTPETDSVAEKINFGVDIDFARKLERERDEARELNAKLIALAERATDDLRWFYESHADGISLELEKLKEGAK